MTETNTMQGKVVRIDKGFAHVHTPDGVMKCALRGKLKRGPRRARNVVAVGDDVVVRPTAAGEGVIEQILERRSKLSRPDNFRPEVEHVIVANVDLLVAVSSVDEPPFNAGLVDRFTVAARVQELELLILLNKVDLGFPEEVRSVLDELKAVGFDYLPVSASTGEGLDLLRDRLRGKTAVFSGHSGVGKSTILNALIPDFRAKVAPVSERTGKGKHTTTRVELVHAPDLDAFIADTPGVKLFGIWGIPAVELGFFFPDFEPYIHDCRFNDCTHRNEPGCAVKEAVERGDISPRRYKSYLNIFEDLLEMEEQTRGY